ncbi:MAG: alpha/beta hydrolase [Bacteroidales bacterium]
MKKKIKIIKIFLWVIIVFFIFINIVAYFHAYKFTHFDHSENIKTKDAKHLTIGEKLKTLFSGVSNPRPSNKITPKQKYKTIKLKSNKEIEAWYIKNDSGKGTVILFHGYSGNKSSMLDKAVIFSELGYNTFLVDFMGSGGSEGNQTTIGFYEAEEVKTAYDYIRSLGEENIILFGTSMGAVAIMKALSDFNIMPLSIIIECPFETMLKTVQSRFTNIGIPSFPLANLLVFWGGFQNSFNAFKHNPIDYSKNISCPTLLLYGKLDEKVSSNEIDNIFQNLNGTKKLKIYPNAGHENYLLKYKNEWTTDVADFLISLKKQVKQ